MLRRVRLIHKGTNIAAYSQFDTGGFCVCANVAQTGERVVSAPPAYDPIRRNALHARSHFASLRRTQRGEDNPTTPRLPTTSRLSAMRLARWPVTTGKSGGNPGSVTPLDLLRPTCQKTTIFISIKQILTRALCLGNVSQLIVRHIVRGLAGRSRCSVAASFDTGKHE